MKNLLTLSCVPFLMFGCNQSEQRGNFAVSSNQRIALSEQKGTVALFRGRRYDERDKEISLLGLIVIDPHDIARFDVSDISHERLTSTIEIAKLRVTNEPIQFKWHREKDTIIVDGKTFDRSQGEIFLVVLTSDNKLNITQLKVENESFSTNEIFELAKSKYPRHFGGIGVANKSDN